jgi:hypothetical protein
VFKKRHQNVFSAGKNLLNLKVGKGHLTSRKFSSTKLAICLISILFINIPKEKQLKNHSRQRRVSFSPWIIQTRRERVQIPPIV